MDGLSKPRSWGKRARPALALFILLGFILLSTNAHAANLSCSVKTSCFANETDVLHMSDLTNAHAELTNESNFIYKICCIDLDSDTALGNTTGTPFLHLSDPTNAQVEKVNESNFNISANISALNPSYDLICDYGTSSCAGYNTCLATISNDTNAHIGDCSAFTSTVCCSLEALNTPPIAENVTLNSTFGTNLTSEDLTVYWDSYDADSDPVYNITTWYLNNLPFAQLNLQFEGGSNSTWTRDYSGLEHNATVVNATWNQTGGYDGFGSYHFNGTTDYLSVPSNTDFNANGPFTLEAWIKWDTDGTNDCIIERGAPGDPAAAYALQILASNQPNFFWESSGGANHGVTSSITVTADGNYHHIVGTFDGTYSRIYVDGNFAGSVDEGNSVPAIVSNNIPLYIGVCDDGPLGRFFPGDIDSVRIYNYSLTSEQITTLFKGRTDLIAYEQTSTGDTWQACITPNDGIVDGTRNCSNSLTVLTDIKPIVQNVTLNSTLGTNTTDENLTAYWDAFDAEGEPVLNITNWHVDGASITRLNMPFEGSEGNESLWTMDYSNYSNDGTVSGALWNSTGGPDGFGAYQFDGIDDEITIPDDSSLTLQTYSLEAVFKYDVSGQTQYIISKNSNFSDVVSANNAVYVLVVESDDNLLFFFENSSGSDFVMHSTGTLSPGQFYHVLVTVDDATDNVSMYIDGSLNATDTTTIVPNTLSNQPVRIGRGYHNINGPENPLNGTISQITLYSRSLSSEQVTALYNNRTDLIVSQETQPGDVWQACVTPNDGYQNGLQNCSNTLTVLSSNIAPIVENVTLNSTFGTNYSNENLTVYWDAFDADSDSIKNVTNWFVDGAPIAVWNMPFEATGGNESDWTKDYSNNSNHGTVNGSTWNGSGGFDGFGAYEFSGTNGYIYSDANSSLTGNPSFTISAHIYIPSGATTTLTYAPILYWGTPALHQSVFFSLYGSNTSQLFVGFFGGGQAMSGTFTNDAWHHVVWVREGGGQTNAGNTLYIDGVNQTLVDALTTGTPNVGISPFYIQGADTGRFFEGTIDDMVVYNYSLSEAQVQALYQNRTDLIVSDETSAGDVWQACVTPNDGTADGLQNCSNTLEVINNVPIIQNVTLNSTFGTNLTDENLTAYWDAYDADSDAIKNITDWQLNGNPFAVLNMPFEADGSNNATDYAGTDDFGSIVGSPFWNSSGGHDGFGAYEFDGASDYIALTNEATFDLVDGMTVMAWIKPSEDFNTTTTIKSIVDKSDFSWRGWLLSYRDSSDGLSFYLTDGASTAYSADYIVNLSADTWYHVVGTFDGNEIKIYVDGQLKNTTVQTFTVGNGVSNVRIGASPITAGRNFPGTIDDVMIYPGALSAEQINLTYQDRTDVIHSSETSVGDVWQACITPNDGHEDGLQNCSNNLTVLSSNIAPIVENVTLNSTFGTNYTTENLTVYWDAYDADSDSIKNTTSWFLNNSPVMLLNMPFENWGSNSTHTPFNYTLDYSNNSNHGTVNIVAFNATGGYDGFGAYQFDGFSSYIDATGYQDKIFTASAWVKPSTANQLKGIVEYSDNLNSRYGIGLDANGQPCIFYEFNLISRYRCATAGSLDGAWHHVVGTFDGSTPTVYVDGSPVTLGNDNVANPATKVNELRIGDRTDHGNYFKGTIDEVALYNRSLTAEQVLALYNNRTDRIVSQETQAGDVWQACITPNDGTEDGLQNCSNTLAVLQYNFLPVSENVTLNSTFGTNLTYENLTVYWDSFDPESGPVQNITNWYLNGSSITYLNMPFEPDGGQNANDYSDSGHNGTAEGGVPYNASGGFAGTGAYEFGGSGSGHGINTGGWNITSGPFSVEAYAYAYSHNSNWNSIVTKWDNVNNGRSWALYTNTVTGFPTLCISSAGTNSFCERASSGMPIGSWHHIVATYNGTDPSSILIFVDGVQQATSTYINTGGVSGPVYAANTTVYIGRSEAISSAPFYFDGPIDDVRVYNRTLTPEQITLLYQNRTDMISFNETSVGNVWQACITPNDGIGDGPKNCSNTLAITAQPPPIVQNVTLNSTFGTNYSNENLTVYWDAYDENGDDIYNISNWYVDGSSIALLNMPFESTGGNESVWTKDYSNHSNHGAVNGAVWDPTGGYDGWGAYSYDGSSTYIDAGTDDSIIIGNNSISITAWVKSPNLGSDRIIIADRNTGTIGTLEGFSFGICGVNPGFCAGAADGGEIHFYAEDVSGNYGIAEWNAGSDVDDGNWHSVALTWERGSEPLIYIDGVENTTISNSFLDVGNVSATANLNLGRRPNGAQYYNGYIDQLVMFNRSLSPEQVLALYNNRTDRIVSQETQAGDVWQACITPNDGTVDGLQNCSNTLEVINIPPIIQNVTLNSTYGTNYSDENLTVYWDAFDAGGDSVYNITNWYLNSTSITYVNLAFEPDGDQNATDYSGNGRNGTAEGAVPYTATGGLGGSGAYDFQGAGSGDGINLGGWNITGAFSAEAWYYSDSNTAQRAIAGKWDSDNENRSWLLGTLATNGRPLFCLSSTGIAASSRCKNGDNSLTPGAWYHIVITYDGVDHNGMKIYVNGTEQSLSLFGGAGNPTGAPYASDTTVYVGRAVSIGGSQQNFDGRIDNVRVYDRELTPEQVLALYNNRTDLIVSNETSADDVWQACITPNDGYVNGLQNCSNNLTVLEVMPDNCVIVNTSYTMTSNFSGTPNNATPLTGLACVKITASDVTFDCDGYYISPDKIPVTTTYGILVNGSLTNITIKNCAGVYGFDYGIYSYQSNYVNITNSTAFNNTLAGIRVDGGSFINVSNNTAFNSDTNFWLEFISDSAVEDNIAYDLITGFYLGESTNNTMARNKAYDGIGKVSGIYLWNATANVLEDNEVYNVSDAFVIDTSSNNNLTHNMAHNSSLYGFYVSDSNSNRLENGTTYNITYGTYLTNVSGSYLIGNDAYDNNKDYVLDSSDGNTLANNTGHDFTGTESILIENSDGNTLLGNEVYGGPGKFASGIRLNLSANNNLTDNIAHNIADVGIYLQSSTGNTLVDNTAHDITDYGYYIYDSESSTITGGTAYDNGYAGMTIDASNASVSGTTFYNNLYDMEIYNIGGGSVMTVDFDDVIFTNPTGTLSSYTNLSMSDTVGIGEYYFMNWSTNESALPTNLISFNQKFINISVSSGTVSINTISWGWTDLESLVFDEPGLQVWKYNSSGWNDTLATLDEGANTLTLTNMDPASIYGILFNGTLGQLATLYGAQVNETKHERYNESSYTGNQSATQGGNLSTLNLGTSQLSERWAAIYGTMEGNITLRDVAGIDEVYKWIWNASAGGVICLSTNSTLSTFTVLPAMASDIDTAWSFTPTASDSAINTFTNMNCTLDIGPTTITNASYADTGQPGGYITCAIKSELIPVKDNMIFCSEIINDGPIWNGDLGDFEVIVPTPSGAGTTETYYFYANLD